MYKLIALNALFINLTKPPAEFTSVIFCNLLDDKNILLFLDFFGYHIMDFLLHSNSWDFLAIFFREIIRTEKPPRNQVLGFYPGEIEKFHSWHDEKSNCVLKDETAFLAVCD